ncbi:MAG TPA: DUF4331 domain-containing protein [Candidatus Sulfotelmatobacter sp.]|nr:DUF4331 domain-containing protein [Candidatus Sulfotelmatobacter sp.]
MSSHREAPGISKDPVADSTDLYAFVSPDHPDTVTILANYIPLEGPAGGPNFYEFGDDVLYEIVIDNDGDADADITYQFRFKTHVKDSTTFLYNTGPIGSLGSASWNRTQTYTITRIDEWGHAKVIGADLTCPPVNIGPRSTPDYGALAQAAVHSLGGGIKVFAGQRREGFFVDLGSIFDLGDLRPFQNLHLIPTAAAPGVDATKDLNVHTIAMQIPMTSLTKGGWKPTDPLDPRSVIGVYTSAHRRKAHIRFGSDDVESGPFVQVSRLGNPLVNEVLIPMARKDYWNGERPHKDSQFLASYAHPELAGLLPVLYPGVFPNLAAYTKDRVDLEAILLTGIPAGIIPGFQNSTGSTAADLLRLNMAIPPSGSPNALGILGGDLAGFPNGRRVKDDVVTIEIRAVAGLTIPLVDPSFTPDGAAGLVTQGLTPAASRYQATFPYLGLPLDGFHNPSS